mmetsp:Transcript_29710/g.36864  ORF Transcript_29710/g.36864 Transcript_29710/m.36864 type:complete len:82 (-) Transcript_29710:1212-1457(-)
MQSSFGVHSAIKIKPLVNMIPETAHKSKNFTATPRHSIKEPRSQAHVQDKFDLKVDLLLEKLKSELAELRCRHVSNDDLEF